MTQSLYYAETVDDLNRFKLLELDEHLQEEVREGRTLQIKGGLTEKVVLCTDSATYELKEAEISNCLMLVPGLKYGQETSTSPLKVAKNGINRSHDRSIDDEQSENKRERALEHLPILKIFHEYFECRPIKPRYRKLYDLLQLTRYSGSENEHCIERKFLFTYKQLLDTTQCSTAEFSEGLKSMRAIQVGTHYRVLSTEYEYNVVSLMVALIEENSWQLDEVNREETFESLKEIVPLEILSGIFEIYALAGRQGKFKYSEKIVCQIIARHILQQGLSFDKDDFMSTWQDALPEGMNTNQDYLNGIGIVDNFSKPKRVKSLNEFILPYNLHERIQVLFKTKDMWTVDEITPFLDCFLTGQQSVTMILMKFTRAVKLPDGQRAYVEKYGK